MSEKVDIIVTSEKVEAEMRPLLFPVYLTPYWWVWIMKPVWWLERLLRWLFKKPPKMVPGTVEVGDTVCCMSTNVDEELTKDLIAEMEKKD